MAPNTKPLFPITPRADAALINAANPGLDGSGTVVSVYAPGANGGRIEAVRVKAQGTTTLGMVRLFIHDGTSMHLWVEISVSAIVPSASTPTFETEYVPSKPKVLPSGYSLRAATQNAEPFQVHVTAGDF